ncbi:SDR family oxidoreductase [Fulvivirgaceae bacterium PWU20]|uniref:SDR family oxidoreductase n=2 Tax=Chryseosolibacter indicus TaxID=2782351 RepID=A0ABS5VQP0_9BACT|nr:SDR family oxidoreductase [Chryseosolibacter indicus]
MATNNENKRNEYALVTGGTSGIGYEIAKLLAKDGYNLVLVARSSDRLLEVSDEFQDLGVDVLLLDKDLFEANAAREIYDELKARNIQIDVLINNAGQGQKGKFNEVPFERHIDVIQLNIVSLVSLTKLFLDDMVARNNGKILNLASVVSKTPAPEFSVYAASKAFVLSFSEALAKELAETNVTITALLPGRTDTDFFHKADLTDSKEYQEHKLADPAEVAKDGYQALMSGKSRIISGAQNKVMVGMMNSMPDSANAANMQKNMQPSDKEQGERKERPGHAASEQEREAMGKEKV